MEILRANRSSEPLFEMAKLTRKYADTTRCNDFGEYIYFSEVLSGHLPRIKFYGGTPRTQSTKDAPSYTFTQEGAGELILENWMNKKNCPNAFDSSYLLGIIDFINSHIAILLLVWFRKLDEADALAYFTGRIDFSELLTDINANIDKSRISSERALHSVCIENGEYRF